MIPIYTEHSMNLAQRDSCPLAITGFTLVSFDWLSWNDQISDTGFTSQEFKWIVEDCIEMKNAWSILWNFNCFCRCKRIIRTIIDMPLTCVIRNFYPLSQNFCDNQLPCIYIFRFGLDASNLILVFKCWSIPIAVVSIFNFVFVDSEIIYKVKIFKKNFPDFFLD